MTMDIKQTTTITDIPYFDTITIEGASTASPITLDRDGMPVSYTVEQVREIRDVLTAAIEAAESNVKPAKPVRLYMPGQIVDGSEDLPVGTRLKDRAGDIWLVGEKGLGLEHGNGLLGGHPLLSIVDDYSPVIIENLPDGNS